MALKVINPGLSTTVQDLGRPGYFNLGIPIGGAMDRLAMRSANLLVGNDEGAAGLEAVFMGPELEFTSDALVAVTGAAMPIKVDGVEQQGWTSFNVTKGQRMTFDYLQSGARIYIAISGGIDVPVALGSRSTYPIGALGGFEGRPVAAGDELPVGVSSEGQVGLSVPEHLRRGPDVSGVELRVLPGLYWHRITEASQKNFFADEWKVAPEADRMGYRFRGGQTLEFVERKQPFGAGSDPSNIVDGCYPYGSIQVPGGTEPIVLHRDAVSGGGYFMLGTVISADMDLIGQLQPHMPTRFVEVTMDQALEARADRSRLLGRIRQAMN
ncbi:MAG: biotin-dependent carboxyltransferase family protein [Alphaproteobacteria bacterium]|nr:biotin-dependent carboxyltransferase family protein [Alphaproteobacteria bacterium]